MLSHKFKLAGTILSILSLSVLIARIIYLINSDPIVIDYRELDGVKANDSINADNYVKTIVKEKNGTVIATTKINKRIIHSDICTFYSYITCLFGLLIICLSKEKIEDEMIDKIRLTAFRNAFVSGIGFGILYSISNFNGAHFSIEYFTVIMLFIYLANFHWLLKRSQVC